MTSIMMRGHGMGVPQFLGTQKPRANDPTADYPGEVQAEKEAGQIVATAEHSAAGVIELLKDKNYQAASDAMDGLQRRARFANPLVLAGISFLNVLMGGGLAEPTRNARIAKDTIEVLEPMLRKGEHAMTRKESLDAFNGVNTGIKHPNQKLVEILALVSGVG